METKVRNQREYQEQRKKRVQRMKRNIMIVLVILLVVPTIVSCGLAIFVYNVLRGSFTGINIIHK